MPAPYVEVYEFQNIGKMASVVLDREDFMAIIDEFEKAEGMVGNWQEVSNKDKGRYERLREAEHIPAIFRGTKTDTFFKRFNIPDDVNVMSAIVRGGGRKIMEKYGQA